MKAHGTARKRFWRLRLSRYIRLLTLGLLRDSFNLRSQLRWLHQYPQVAVESPSGTQWPTVLPPSQYSTSRAKLFVQVENWPEALHGVICSGRLDQRDPDKC